MSQDKPSTFMRIGNLRRIANDPSVNNFARSICLEASNFLAESEKWNGKNRRCDHEMKWVSDWYGDPSVVNGTSDCSRSECEICGWVDPNGERPEPDPDELRDGWEAA